MDNRLIEQIDNYHSGKMSPEEIASFESELNADPAIKAESDFQGDIVNGLKEFRKDQLKARLDAVDLAPSWIEFAQQSTLMKSFGGIAVATIIGTGVYLNAEKGESYNVDPIVIDAPNYEDPEFIWSLGLEDLPSVATKPVQQKTIASSAVVAPIEVVKVEEKEEAIEEKEEMTFNPSFDAPDAKTINDEEAMETSNLDELPEETVAEANETPINVETEITKAIKVKYKYYDGKLFLSGDFDRAPYEILEINSASGRRIYVKYLDKYYKVGVTDQLSDLPEVTDQAVIDELDLLRQNK